MSFGTSVKLPDGSIYFNRVSLRSMSDLVDMKDEASKEVQQAKEQLLMLASATPKDLFTGEDGVMFQLTREFNDTWESLQESFYNMNRADIVIDELDGWSWRHKDEFGEEIAESLDPSKPEDWRRIASGDYMYETDKSIKATSLDALDKEIDKVGESFFYKQDKIRGKYVLYYKNRLFHTSDNVYLFSSEESAYKHFFDSLDFSFIEMTKKSYIEKNQTFLRQELAKYLGQETKQIEEYNSLLDAVLASKEDNTMEYYEQMSKLGDYIRMTVQNYMKSFVEVVKLAE